MLPNHYGHPENLKNPEEPPKRPADTWIALGAIVAMVLLVIFVLTVIGAG